MVGDVELLKLIDFLTQTHSLDFNFSVDRMTYWKNSIFKMKDIKIFKFDSSLWEPLKWEKYEKYLVWNGLTNI